jgi:hypothetical protein
MAAPIFLTIQFGKPAIFLGSWASLISACTVAGPRPKAPHPRPKPLPVPVHQRNCRDWDDQVKRALGVPRRGPTLGPSGDQGIGSFSGPTTVPGVTGKAPPWPRSIVGPSGRIPGELVGKFMKQTFANNFPKKSLQISSKFLEFLDFLQIQPKNHQITCNRTSPYT